MPKVDCLKTKQVDLLELKEELNFGICFSI